MRFCTLCGNTLPGQQPPAQQPPAPAAPAPQVAYAPPVVGSPMATAGAEVAEKMSQAIGGPLCWRCRGVGDPGSEFCKFCGARYADVSSPHAAPAMGVFGGAASPSSPGGLPAAQPAAQPAIAPFAQPPMMAPVHAQPLGQPLAVTHVGAGGGVPAPARLVSIMKDGSDGASYPLVGEQIDIGRTEGDIVLADDPYLSPRHARLRRRGDGYSVRDLDSVNGVYVRLKDGVELADGDMILLGQQVLRFELLADGEAPIGPAQIGGVFVFGTPEVPRVARLVVYSTEGIGRDFVSLYRGETVLGRENGDLVFTDDPFLSRRHASIKLERGSRRFVLKDLGSSNGTSIRIRGERPVGHGDQFRVGKHLFRLDVAGGQQAPR